MAKCPMNKRMRGGKCVPRKGFFKFFNRKTNNPFRLIGSYIGALVAVLLVPTTTPQTIFGFIGLDQILVIPIENSIRFVFMDVGMASVGIAVAVVFGFFIGYGIQLILRLFRK